MHLVAAKMSSNFCFKTLPSLSGLKQNRNSNYFRNRDNYKGKGVRRRGVESKDG